MASALRLAVVVSLSLASLLKAEPHSIKRLDGTRISVVEAEAFARQQLTAANVMGAQLAVINHGRRVWMASFGNRRLSPVLPFDESTTTWAASITKPVFATYVMKLVERGEFNLDLPVARQLPRPLDSYQAYKESATELVKNPLWATVTPRMLLSHSSGLLNFAWLEPDKKMRLHFTPGSQYLYSGEGMNLVQFVIEQRKGRTLDLLMQDELFTPLRMTRTGMIYRQGFADDVADRFDATGKFLSQTKRFPARAAGNMTTSAGDMANFLSALLNGEVIQAKTLRQMLTPIQPIRSKHQFALDANEPEGGEAEEVGLAYGIGWGLLTRTRFGPAFFKEGHGDGAQNYVICFSKQKTCMILLTNSDNGELAFRPLLEKIIGDTVTPWEWEGYTPSYIQRTRTQGQ